MWMHWENGIHYGEARAAVAYAAPPTANIHIREVSVPTKTQGLRTMVVQATCPGTVLFLWIQTEKATFVLFQ